MHYALTSFSADRQPTITPKQVTSVAKIDQREKLNTTDIAAIRAFDDCLATDLLFNRYRA